MSLPNQGNFAACVSSISALRRRAAASIDADALLPLGALVLLPGAATDFLVKSEIAADAAI